MSLEELSRMVRVSHSAGVEPVLVARKGRLHMHRLVIKQDCLSLLAAAFIFIQTA